MISGMGGEGAPLTPIFQQLLIANQKKMDLPVSFMNIGGISNITIVKKDGSNELFSKDIGPGNCLIDSWVRKIQK